METTLHYENLTVHYYYYSYYYYYYYYYYLYKGKVQCPKTGGQVGKQVHII
jgi:hypothetical protein